MRVVFCISSLGLGGAEEIVCRLANFFSAEHDVDLVLIQRCKEDLSRIKNLNKNVKLKVVLPGVASSTSFLFRIKNVFSYFLSPFLAIYLWLFLSLKRADIIHVNLTQFALVSFFWGIFFRAGNKIVQTFHTNLHLLKEWQKIIFKLSWKVARKIIVEIDEKEISKIAFFVKKDKIIFIPFAIGGEWRTFNLTSNKILSFGSLARLRIFEKKYDLIIEALSELKKAGFFFNYFIGGDGPDFDVIKRLVDKYGLVDNVFFLGYVADPSDFFKRIDLFLVATVDSECGIAGLQALKSGVPIVGVNTFERSSSLARMDPGSIMYANTSQELSQILSFFYDNIDLLSYHKALVQEKACLLDDHKMMESYKSVFRIQNS